MYRLQVLGSPSLRARDGTAVRLISSQPKLLALLSYLAIPGSPHVRRRDTLLAVFWPELDESSARHALSQALSKLRRELGEEVMDGKWRDPVCLSGEGLWCDARAFREAARAGRDEEALALYGGSFLEGLHVPDAPEFEQWRDDERRELASQAVRSALALSERHARAARWKEAADWGRVATRLDPYGEPGWRALLTALSASGDRAAALAEFARLSRRLDEDVGIAPSAEIAGLAGIIRDGSYPAPASTALPEVTVPKASQVPDAAPAGSAQPWPGAEETVSSVGRVPSARHRRVVLAGLILAGALASAGLPLVGGWGRGPELDAAAIVIFPFQPTESDSLLQRLAAAMPLLLSRRLGDVRAIPVATTPARLGAGPGSIPGRRRAARRARDAGGGRMLLGMLGSAPAGVTLTATLIDTNTRGALAEFSLESRAEAIDAALDDLVAGLLARAGGEPEARIPHLLQAPLPALHSYLDGQMHLRAGRSADALRAFVRALEIDTTFATAALAASVAAGAGGGPWLDEGVARAGRWRDRLSTADRDLVRARLGPRHPAPSSLAERLGAWENLAARVRLPYEYEALYGYGDLLFHWGPLLGIPHAHERARVVFARAAALDATRPGALQHLADLAFIRRDTAALRHATDLLRARELSDSAHALALWMRATGLRDTAAWRRVPRDFDLAPLYNLPLQSGVAVPEAERVVARWREQALTLAEVVDALRLQAELALNQGRPRLAALRMDSAGRLARSTPHLAGVAADIDRQAVLSVLYWEGDTAAAGPFLQRLRVRASAAPPEASAAREEWRFDRCTLEQWRTAHGGVLSDAAVRELERGRPAARVCGAMLRALATHEPTAIAALDTIARTGAPGWEWTGQGNLVLARLLEGAGDTTAAYEAVQRRGVYYLRHNRYLGTILGEHWRLGVAVGDTAGAAAAARHFLALRDSPEPVLTPRRDSIRAWLTAHPRR